MSKRLKKNEKKRTIKIPVTIKVLWCNKKKIILFKGLLRQKSLKINPLITIDCTKREIEIISDISGKLSNWKKKKIHSIKKTTTSILKQLLVEVTAPMHYKLKLVGVGYRAFPVKNFEDQLLLLRLGYSHPIYFKIPVETSLFCLKLTQLFLYGNSYQQITFTASKIRSNKVPEPYKGKGILYENEKVLLKEGKKI